MPPTRKQAETFDEHLGAVVEALALPHGGRDFLVTLLDWSKGTVIRRISGETPFLVREIEIIAPQLNTTSRDLVAQALRNYAAGTEEQGVAKLRTHHKPKSVAPASFEEHKAKKQKQLREMSTERIEQIGERAAIHDTELEQDEPDAP